MTIKASQEALANAVPTGAPLPWCMGTACVAEIDTVLDSIGGACRLDLDVTTEAYLCP